MVGQWLESVLSGYWHVFVFYWHLLWPVLIGFSLVILSGVGLGYWLLKHKWNNRRQQKHV